jgi:hypothetical protein
MRPVKSRSAAGLEATPFVVLARKAFAGPDVGDSLPKVGAVPLRAGDIGRWIVLISAAVVGVGVTWRVL